MLEDSVNKCKSKHAKYPKSQALKSVEEKIVQLGDLAVKLGGFVGQSESVKKAVKNAIIAKINSSEELKNVYSSHVTNLSESVKSDVQADDTVEIGQLKQKVSVKIDSLTKEIQQLEKPNNLNKDPSASPSTSAESDKLQSKLDALEKVEKLCEFLSNSNKQQNPSKKLLENLCTGLETFLGFNKDSKGYDGTGIVYSDLDRLCDGVMGFLSSIITDVNNDKTLKKYNTKLPEILEKIELAKYKGKRRFDATMISLTRDITKWVKGVEKKHESVLTPLNNLLEIMIGHMSAKMLYRPITDQLANWQGFAGDYLGEIQKSEEALKNIDDNLGNKISPKIELVRVVVQNFWNSVNEDTVKIAVTQLRDDFTQHRSEIGKYIGSQIQEVEKRISQKYDGINLSINSLRRTKGDQIRLITSAVQAAQQLVKKLLTDSEQDGFERKYKKGIIDKFNETQNAIEYFTVKNTPLMANSSTVNANVESLEGDVRHGLEQLRDRINKLDTAEIVQDALSQLTKAKATLDECTGVDNGRIKAALGELHGLFGKHIKDKLRQAVNQIGAEIGKLCQSVGEDGARKMKIFLEKVQKEVVKESENSHNGGSNQLVKQYYEYVDNFITNYQTTVSKWVDEAMLREGLVERVYLYVSGTTEQSWKKIPGAIKKANQEILNIVTTAGTKPTHTKDNVQATLTTVQKFFDGVKSKVDVESSKTKIVSSIESDLGAKQSDYKSQLEDAVKAVFTFISSKASAESLVISKLIMEPIKIEEITRALTTSPTLVAKLGKACNADVDGKIEAVRNAVQALDNNFRDDVINKLTEEVQKLPGAVTTFNKMAETQINTVGEKAIDEAVNEFGKDGNIQVASLMGQFHQSELILKSAVKQIQEQLVLLKKVPDTVSTKSGEADQLLEDLRAKLRGIQRAISLIESSIKTAESAFDNAIQGVETALRSARDTTSMAMTALKSNLQTRVIQALNDLEDSVQKMFADHKNAELKTICTSASEQISSVRSVIDDDMETGLKGLMVKLRDTCQTHKLQPVDATLSLFATKVRIFHHNLFSELLLQSDLTDHSPLLAPLKAGLSKFAEQLGHAYVNRFSGRKFGKLLEKKPPSTDQKATEKQLPDTSLDNYDLTPEGRNCAKVCLTIVEMVMDGWVKLGKACYGNMNAQINLDKGNRLGIFLRTRGYNVASGAKSQDGELQNKEDVHGLYINTLREKRIKLPKSNDIDASKKRVEVSGSYMKFSEFVATLYDSLNTYYDVCHLRHIERPKTPTNIYQMLMWLTGLPHNRVNAKLSADDFGQLFEKPETGDEEANGDDPPLLDHDPDTLEAYPKNISVSDVSTSLRDVCAYSETVLTSILGRGHADGIYAVDFNTNPDGLSYPTAPGACFDLLVDISKRLYDQLYFLFIQCSRTYETNSWRDCWYGQHVGGSDWRCNEKQCINQMGNQSADQNGKQTCGQTCDRHPSCGLKSPLQSFLEDGLPGFLPHSFKKPGCKLDCTVSNHRGLPCKTPMGFGDISVTASRASRGERIVKVLDAFCGRPDSPLTKLRGYLNCLLQMPPRTLGDIYAFYYNLILGWGKRDAEHKKNAYDGAVAKAYFGVDYTELDVSILFFTEAQKGEHSSGDLLCLFSCDSDSTMACGRYLQPFGLNTWTVFSKDHADKYLSWIVYLTETFYHLIKQLYEECCTNCTKAGTRCHDKICDDKCKVKSLYKSQELSSEDKQSGTVTPKASHDKRCKTIANCPFTRPTLCKYGFVLQSPSNLSGINGTETIRTCKDLCNALHKVLEEKSVLMQFIYAIDNYLRDIRMNFMITTLALWSLSLLYLLHIMVIRLDLLHIKSHLHSPSSHRIAAQSLLAAGRVNKLNRVFYLQP